MSHILIVSYSLSILVSALWFVKILIRRIKSKSWLDDLVRLTNNQPINVVTTGSTARNQSVSTSNNQHQRDLILMRKLLHFQLSFKRSEIIRYSYRVIY